MKLSCEWWCGRWYLLSAPALSSLAPGAQTYSWLPEPRDPHQPGTHTGWTAGWRGRRVTRAGQSSGVMLLLPFHTSTRASTWWRRMGLLQNSTRGLGTLRVSGRSRVPYPPTRIRAFMSVFLIYCYQGDPRTSELTRQPAWAKKRRFGLTRVNDQSLNDYRIFLDAKLTWKKGIFYNYSFSTKVMCWIPQICLRITDTWSVSYYYKMIHVCEALDAWKFGF